MARARQPYRLSSDTVIERLHITRLNSDTAHIARLNSDTAHIARLSSDIGWSNMDEDEKARKRAETERMFEKRRIRKAEKRAQERERRPSAEGTAVQRFTGPGV